MKKITKITVVLLVIAMIMPIVIYPSISNASNEPELRGVWVASVVNIDYPSKPTTDVETLKSEAIRILDNAKAMRMNAVFLQVRPAGDALYKSKYFPWSKYLTGVQGQAPINGFDPLEFWVTEAHNRGIQLHAWLNPYRVTKIEGNEPKHNFDSLASNNPAKLHPEWVVKHFDGNLYYDPGIPEVRQLVMDGIMEIVENYDVDGIHFDDYFYPGTSFEDKATFEKYGKAYPDINSWRRANVDALISDISKEIKQSSKDVSFGISPFGIWANKSTNPLGSDTKGNQTYYSHYADTRKWVKEGWLDYIAPQIYWNIGYTIADYSKIVAWWEDVVKDTGVKLYIGQAAYKAMNANPDSAWYGVAEIEKQLQYNAKSSGVNGSIFFSYKSLANNPALGAVVRGVYEQKDGIVSSIPVSIARPSSNIKTGLSQFYIDGASDPSKPLLVNGYSVEGRSKSGYFGILVPLQAGPNVFTFYQEGSYSTKVIYRTVPSVAPAKMSAPDIIPASVFPKTQEYRSPGEKVTLSCQAPLGSYVTVKIGNEEFMMKPSAAKPNLPGIFLGTYTFVYTIPSYEGSPGVVDLGAPEYFMNYYAIKKTLKAPASIGVIMKGAPIYAEVSRDVADTYNTPTTSNGASYELYKGMKDYVTAMTGSYVRLSSGQWINKNNVNIIVADAEMSSAVVSASYNVGENWDSMVLGISGSPAAVSSFDGVNLRLDISKTSAAALPVLPADSLVSTVTVSENEDKAQYILTLNAGQRIEGYYVQKTDTGLILNIKRPIKAKDGEQPLAGISIMLDPGHGGNDPGAVGPLGVKYPEKTINLGTATKLKVELEGLGATVLMTRTTDEAVSLESRLAASRNARPDLFISIHANSMGDNVDISKVDGFSVFYREELAKPLAACVFDYTIQSLVRNNKGLHDKNLYVTRGTWTPSILFESGFVPNPNEFEWLIDDSEQTRLAKAVSEAILKYLKQ